jgi:hypothetical protein
MGEMKNAHRIFIGEPEGKRNLGDLSVCGRIILNESKGIEWDAVDWIHLAQDRDQWRALVNTSMNLRIP